MSGLQPNTTYYARAYATNAIGTAYGNTVMVTTLQSLSIGQNYQGGVIAYIFTPGDPGFVSGQTHGLIVSGGNLSTGIQWGCSGFSISGTNVSLGTGQSNTALIINNCGSTNAASICNDFISNGYSDWYLPSREELNKIFLNRAVISGLLSVSYWSSSQSSSTSAWSINFTNGSISSSTTKTSLFYVRAVRSF
jgi:hypothetical protein